MTRRHLSGPDRLSFFASVGIHVLAVVLAVLTAHRQRDPLPEFVTYEIELVSPLPPAQAEEDRSAAEEFAVERPEPPAPEPVEPQPEEEVTVEEPTRPEPDPAPVTPPPEPEEEETTATSPDTSTAEETGEGLNVRMEGLRRDYPAYYNNIIQQIHRCFRWRGQGRWATTLYFEILRDGRVEDIRVLEPSGNLVFDIEAQGAVECAGAGRLGPLPEDLPYDRFPIRFRIEPSGGLVPLPADAFQENDPK